MFWFKWLVKFFFYLLLNKFNLKSNVYYIFLMVVVFKDFTY